MNTPRYAAAAAKLIGKHLPVAVDVAGDRARGVATIERALVARTRRRRFVAVGAVFAAAALVVLATQLVKLKRPPVSEPGPVSINASALGKGAAVGQGVSEHPLGAHASLEAGQRIETPADGGASLRLSTGTSIDLTGRTSFRVDGQGAVQRFSLQHGELSAHVAKLTSTQRFIVDTPDAEVEVRGTRFHLRVLELAEQCGSGTRTRLEVSEGVVEVRTAGASAILVKAGQIWPTDCDGAKAKVMSPATPASTSALGDATVDKRELVSNPARAANHDDASERASALAAPNDLFAEGVSRRRLGDVSGALRAYQALLSRFPSNPLAENAMVERMRLLAGSGEGRLEAKRYLLRYPQGFAQEEARKLVAEP